MTDSLLEGIGLPVLPVTDTNATTLVALDPARDALLDLLAAALNYELAAAWDDATTDTPLAGRDPVHDKVPQPLTEELVTSRANFFPLLSVARADGETSTFEESTIWETRFVCPWDVEYVLGPLTVGNQRKLRDVLTMAGKIVALTVRRGSHLAHQDGALVLAAAGLSSIRVVNLRLGTAKFAEGSPTYHALNLRIETTELSTIADDAPPFGGVSMNLGGDLPGLYEVDTEA